jgi:hypothetical protein
LTVDGASGRDQVLLFVVEITAVLTVFALKTDRKSINHLTEGADQTVDPQIAGPLFNGDPFWAPG